MAGRVREHENEAAFLTENRPKSRLVHGREHTAVPLSCHAGAGALTARVMPEQLPSMPGPDLVREEKRTHMCGDVRSDDVGARVVLMGWVHGYRNLGGAVFIDLRDRAGLVQLVFDANDDPTPHAVADQLAREWVIGVVGKVRKRAGKINANLPSGEVEVVVSYIQVFNRAETPPFEIEDDVETYEEKRLEYRYLDLRRPILQRNLMLRSKITQIARRRLTDQGFVELETPYLVKYTPGGARNFVVPCRLNPGTFYALAESPQLYKQLFMMAGYDRYFQITRCFRDEDLRQDRQPEFTQIDLEMSFAHVEDVQTVMQNVVRSMFSEGLGVDLPEAFPQMTYDEAMARYGSDKPDLRFGLEHVVLTDVVDAYEGGGLPLFKSTLEAGGMIKGMKVPAAHKLSRSDVDKLEKDAKQLGAGGLGRAKVGANGAWTQSPFAKSVSEAMRLAINAAMEAEEGDMLLFQFGKPKQVHMILNQLRLKLGQQFGLMKDDDWRVLWVTEFPLFEHDEASDTFAAAHHPFTSPRPEDVDRLTTDPASCRAVAYDLVLNGVEVAGGSVRIHDPVVQSKVFDALAISEEEQRAKFGFLLDALAYGCPPHAGIAGGMDRIAMLLAKAASLRDVIAYPKTTKGLDLMTGAPTPIDNAQLAEAHVKSLGSKGG